MSRRHVNHKNPTSFANKVYETCKKIPAGKVATYKTLAAAIGSPKAFRAVGSALRKNPVSYLYDSSCIDMIHSTKIQPFVVV